MSIRTNVSIPPRLLTWTNGWLVIAAAFIQGVMLWGITSVKDFEGGDTMGYVFRAREYPTILYSPMYTGAMRIVLEITGDAYAANVVTRVFALIVIAVLVMLVFRRFLSPALSLLLIVIFAFNPGYVDAMYTVHLWGMILPLIALVAVAYLPVEKSIAWALALLVINAMVMRNEYILVPLLFIALLMFPGRFVDWRNVWPGAVRFLTHTWYVWALVIACGAVLAWVSVEPLGSDVFRQNAESKHTMNVCQIYAFYRMQIGDTRVVDPWNLCQQIMQADFGVTQPSFVDAFFANPRAIIEMVLYNVSLLPNGVQVLLTGGFFGGDTPDYWAQRTNFLAPITAAALLLVAGRGAWTLRGLFAVPSTSAVPSPASESTHRSADTESQRTTRAERAFFLLCASILVTMLFIALSQRPRPSYIFLTTVVILLFVGIGITAMRVRAAKWASLVIVIALATSSLVTQIRNPLFGPNYVNLFYGQGQPVLDAYRQLQPIAAQMPPEPLKLVITAPADAYSLCSYIRRRFDTCTAVVGSDATLTWTLK